MQIFQEHSVSWRLYALRLSMCRYSEVRVNLSETARVMIRRGEANLACD